MSSPSRSRISKRGWVGVSIWGVIGAETGGCSIRPEGARKAEYLPHAKGVQPTLLRPQYAHDERPRKTSVRIFLNWVSRV